MDTFVKRNELLDKIPKMSTELNTISTRAITKLKMEETQRRLTRSSSLDTIKKFNTFICAQQYYILPALMNWLKHSQTSFQASTESTTCFIRGSILNAFFRFYLVFFKNIQPYTAEKMQIFIKKTISVVIANFFEKFSKCFEPTFLLKIGVYSACVLVFLQLLFSVYLIYLIFLPYGFIFLIACMLTIKYLSYKTMITILTKPKRGDKKLN